MIAPGDPVRVLEIEKEGHVRTPDYVKGKTGRVVSVLGEFKDPESLAYGGSGLPEKALYKTDYNTAINDDAFGDKLAKTARRFQRAMKRRRPSGTEDK